MRRYLTRDEIIQQEDDRRWSKEPTKEQPMSDTLQEEEDQMMTVDHDCIDIDNNPTGRDCAACRNERQKGETGEHQVTKSGTCVIPGCPCRGWSAQEKTMSKNDYQRFQFPVGATIEAIRTVGRGGIVSDIPIGTRGKVTSHCDDGRAWVFFDGYDEGHTFHEIEKFVRVVQLPIKEVSDQTATTATHQPAAQGGGERVKIELINGVEGQCVAVNDYRICGSKPWGGGSVAKSWTTDKNDVLRAFLTPDQKHAWLADELEVVSVNQRQSLTAEREGLGQTLVGISLLAHAAWQKCVEGDGVSAAIFAEIEQAAKEAISQKGPSE